MARKLIDSTTGEGKALNDMLRKALGIPDTAQWFEVRFAAGEPVSVKCEFHPTGHDQHSQD